MLLQDWLIQQLNNVNKDWILSILPLCSLSSAFSLKPLIVAKWLLQLQTSNSPIPMSRGRSRTFFFPVHVFWRVKKSFSDDLHPSSTYVLFVRTDHILFWVPTATWEIIPKFSDITKTIIYLALKAALLERQLDFAPCLSWGGSTGSYRIQFQDGTFTPLIN